MSLSRIRFIALSPSPRHLRALYRPSHKHPGYITRAALRTPSNTVNTWMMYSRRSWGLTRPSKSTTTLAAIYLRCTILETYLRVTEEHTAQYVETITSDPPITSYLCRMWRLKSIGKKGVEYLRSDREIFL
jgi:hypothetical protein